MRFSSERSCVSELLCLVLGNEILNATALLQMVLATTVATLFGVVIGTSATDCSGHLSSQLLQALTLVPVSMGENSSCIALVSECSFGGGKSVKLSASKGNEQGEEGRDILHVLTLLLLTEILGKLSPFNAVDLGHLTCLELLIEHLYVPRLGVIHDSFVWCELIPLPSGVIRPVFEFSNRCRVGDARKGREQFLEGLLVVHGRQIVSGHVVIVESFEEFRSNTVRLAVGVLESCIVVLRSVHVIT